MKIQLLSLFYILAVASAKNGNSPHGGTDDGHTTAHSDANANHVTSDDTAATTDTTATHEETTHETYDLTVGSECTVSYNANSGKYSDNKHAQCADGLVCYVGEHDDGSSGDLTGTCMQSSCYGKKDPDDDEDTGTDRVTICHRTCSETNPWVRITIDDDAWSDLGSTTSSQASGCGHSLQHDIRDECANKAPWTAWGAHRTDYLIKWHGSHADTRTREGFDEGSAAEKAYWRYWERACPYVRQDKCCDWAEGSCCGDDPNATASLTQKPSPGPTASPTKAPTATPTATPSKAPTKTPTATPTGAPSQFEGLECPTMDTVKLLGTNHVPGDHYGEGSRLPVQVTEMGVTNSDGRATVSYRVCPSLMNPSESFYVAQTSPDEECAHYTTSDCVEHTAVCTETASAKFAIINVFAERTSGGKSDILPECCGTGSVKEFTFRLACECPSYQVA